MNGGAGSGAVDFFHGFQVAIMLTLMINLVQFTFWTCRMRRSGNTLLEVHGPTLLVFASFVLVNIQPMWILIIGSWKLCCGTCEAMGLPQGCSSTGYTYTPWPDAPGTARECSSGGNVFWDESYCSGGKLSIFPTQLSGWIIQIVCTWGGYVCMFIGVFQATQLHVKLRKKWSSIRRSQS